MRSPWISEETGAVLPGWHSPCYQATAGPVMLACVPQTFFVMLALPSIIIGMLMPKALIVSALIYGVAFLGTSWEPYWYEMLKEYFSYRRHYEG